MTEGDLETVARLHVSCLPDSMVSELGLGYARAFYRYVERSPSEFIILERNEDSRAVAACVVSMASHSLNRRLLVGTRLLPYLLPYLLLHSARVAALALHSMRAASRFRSESEEPELPEVILIFVSPSARGKGLGSELVRKVEKRLADMGIPEYLVKTVSDPSNAALGFYTRLGFDRSHLISTLGKTFQVFARRLPISAVQATQKGD